jgi:hypothetical protein
MLKKLVDSIIKEYQTKQEAQINTLAKEEQQDRSIGLAPRNWILIFEALALVDSYFTILID